MFTGIIVALGTVRSMERRGGDVRLQIESPEFDFSDVSLGDSIAVNGVCLTVVQFDAHGFCADVSNETLSCTTLGEWKTGSPVNLEKALLASQRLGGHFVSGHVDGVGSVVSLEEDARSVRVWIRTPHHLMRYVATKGSVCVDGTSLTVNEIREDEFGVNIVPHTMERTVFGAYAPGTAVNLEVDLLARYLDRLREWDAAEQVE